MLKTLTHDVVGDNLNVIVHNMHESETYKNKDLFMISCLGWLEYYGDKTINDLEYFLRSDNFSSHLVAFPFEKNEKSYLKGFNANDELEYECAFICLDKEAAINKLLTQSDSYEENYEKLKKSGIIQISNISEIEENDAISTLNNGVKNGTKRLEFIKFSPLESIREISKQIQLQFKKKPKISVVGNANGGIPLYSFVDNEDNIMTDIGWVIHENDSGEKIYELVQLQ